MKKKATGTSTTIRERFGLSQPDWAQYLGISQGHLAMHETNKRQLTTAASEKMNDHLQQHYRTPANVQKAMAEQPGNAYTTYFFEDLQSKLGREVKRLRAAKTALAAMQKKYSQAVHLRHFVLQQQQRANLDEGEKLWLAAQDSQTAIDKNKCGPLPQQELQLTISSVHGYLEGIVSMLNSLTTKNDFINFLIHYLKTST